MDYKKSMSYEEINDLRAATNNFLTEFEKANISSTVRGLISRAYNEVNKDNSLTDVDDINGDLFSLVNDFSTNCVDDAITSGALTFGAKFHPTNFTESLVNLLHKYGNKEAIERSEIFKMKFSTGEIPSKKENPERFSSEMKRIFNNLSLSSNLAGDFKSEYELLSLEEEDIIQSIKDQIIEDVEKTEDKQKFISDVMEEVNNVKQEYAKAAEPEEIDSDNTFSEDAGSQSSDSDDSDDAGPKASSDAENYDFGEEGKDEPEESPEKSEEETDEDENTEEGMGVAGTYQNEDHFGSEDFRVMKIFPEDFDKHAYPELTKELKSIEDAIFTISKEAALMTYGSESWVNKNKEKHPSLNLKFVQESIDYLFNQDKFFKQPKASDNIVKFKEYLETKPLIGEENYEESHRRFKITIPTSEEVIDMGIKSHGRMRSDSDFGPALESYNSVLKQKFVSFMKNSGIKNYLCSLEDGCLNVIQTWKFKEGNKLYSNESYEDIYNLLSLEDFTDNAALAEIPEVGTVAPNGSVEPNTLLEDGMNEAKTVIASNPGDQNGDVKVVNPMRGAEKDNEKDDLENVSEEAMSIRLSEFDKVHLPKIKSEIKRLKDLCEKNLKRAFDVVFTEEMLSKYNSLIVKEAMKKGKTPKLLKKDELYKEIRKHIKVVDESKFMDYIQYYKKESIKGGLFNKKGKYKKFVYMTFPSQAALEDLISRGARKIDWGKRFGLVAIILFFLSGWLTLPLFMLYLTSKNSETMRAQFNKFMENEWDSDYLKFYKPFFLHSFEEGGGFWAELEKTANGSDEYWYYTELDFKIKSKEGFEMFYSDESLINGHFPKSMLKFERSPMISAEDLSIIYLRKGDDGKIEFQDKLNKAVEELEVIAYRNSNKKALEKLDNWKKVLQDAQNLWKEKSMAITKIGLRPDKIIDNYKDSLGTRAVVKNLINRGFYIPEGLNLRIKNLLPQGQYEGSLEDLVDKTFVLEITRKKWDKIYNSAAEAREALELREEELEKSLIEATPEEKSFVKNLRDSLVFKNLDRFFTFDSLINDFQSIFYKFQDNIDINSLVGGDGIQSQVLKGLESKRGFMTESQKDMVVKYLGGAKLEKLNPTRYEQFTARLIHDEKMKASESSSEVSIFNPEIAKGIRDKAKVSMVCEMTRRALGLETPAEKFKLDTYLNNY